MSSGRLPLVFWEVRKILRKKESYLFLIMVLIPVLYGIGFASGSDSFIYRGTEPMSCLRWVQTIFVMVQQFLIFHIALVIVVVRALSSEIEDRSILLYIPRVNSRARIFRTKILAVVRYGLLGMALLVVVGVATYYLFMINVPEVASGVPWASGDMPTAVLVIGLIVLGFLVAAFIGLLLASYLKPLLAIAIGVVALIVMALCGQLPVVAYLTPQFYLARLQDLWQASGARGDSVGNPSLVLFTSDPWAVALLGVGVSVAIMGICYWIGLRHFERRDLG